MGFFLNPSSIPLFLKVEVAAALQILENWISTSYSTENSFVTEIKIELMLQRMRT